ncbi:MAG: DNA polymerase III subunit gamma/tau [Flavobacteriales bacterium]|jgi:DNA polymerase-3 subunit gamma/tau|nr:DNA polymerase III subunit gamma/tau [Flavobacteriales bacterium]
MSNYVVSARKYRPQTFDTVVGQSAITTTLKNAIKNDHLAQAFLFFGSRGVGKTTTARILAKTINCLNLSENTEPCNNCESCTSFNEGHSFNILELDAASNNSVDDIRNLIDQVRIAPQLGNHKIFIIDEVHMLSQSAFNAFLKTLEEPPEHAVFILATTEKHKILPTILSRCQIFDFHRIQIEDIVGHLKNIAQKESIKVDDKALHIIGQKADGALRDALSIFDQIASFSNNNLTYEAVLENLNVLDYDYYFKLVEFALASNIAEALLLYDDILSKGFDGSQFLIGLSEHLRDLLVCKDPKTVDLLDVPADIKGRYSEQAAQTESEFILVALDLIRDTEINYRASKNKRLSVEICLMKFCSIMANIKKEVVS